MLVSIPEARRQLGGIGNTLFYELVNNRDVPIHLVKIGRRSMVRQSDLESYIATLPAGDEAA
ncbi:helix-turn-helix domain-containing protein [Rhodospirillaceae bacterium KN72]|uniref:Helix-turn-helix domain-containing protein n=1 Tax=Pacificispira spongiicola TaxID=2729598 RepID=A0A7Y0E2F7_9PROT|nr:DNA-binding protein [Pacificispira spongiicola]NMM45956.1 helix-turn-helix domain-containing protein [Pacificispira spongiicola]